MKPPTSSAIELYAKPSKDFAEKLAQTQTLLLQAANEFAGSVVQASSLGAEDMVISHLINALALPSGTVGIFVLDTCRLHTQTLDLLAQLQATSATPVTVYQPDTHATVQFVTRHGANPMFESIALRKACCDVRKMEPLKRALAGQKAWITGLRREQSGNRAEVPLVDTSTQPTKFNPLANWTWGDVWHFIEQNHIAYNPLHDQFFPSIGCEPCTRAIAVGEDFRAGRWWWEDEAAKECGLHATSTLQQTCLQIEARQGA